jgi:hypothetical protein
VTGETFTTKTKTKFTGPNIKWLTAFVAAMVMVAVFTTVLTSLKINDRVDMTNDQLQCLQYELNAHRIEDQRDAEQNAKEHGFQREPQTEPALDLPNKLRASCEEILPGSTERGEPE